MSGILEPELYDFIRLIIWFLETHLQVKTTVVGWFSQTEYSPNS